MWWRRRAQDALPDPAPTAEEALEERLSAYLDGELDGAERGAVEALLASDPDARATLADFRLVRAALGTLADVRAPRSFAIAAPAAASSRVRLLTRRIEMATRLSAAGAALLFVIAVTNPMGGTALETAAPTSAEDAAMSAGAGAQGEAGAAGGTLQDGEATLEAGVETMRAAGAEEPSPGAPGADAPPEGPTTLAAPSEADSAATPDAGSAPSDAGTGGDAPAGEEALLPAAGGAGGGTEAFAAPQPEPQPELQQRTFDEAQTSEGAAGVAPALAILAVMLGAIAVLMARYRSQGDAARR